MKSLATVKEDMAIALQSVETMPHAQVQESIKPENAKKYIFNLVV